MSYLVLGDLAVNTLRSMVSAQWQDKAAWSTSSAIAAMAEGAKQVSRGSWPWQRHGAALAIHQSTPALPSQVLALTWSMARYQTVHQAALAVP